MEGEILERWDRRTSLEASLRQTEKLRFPQNPKADFRREPGITRPRFGEVRRVPELKTTGLDASGGRAPADPKPVYDPDVGEMRTSPPPYAEPGGSSEKPEEAKVEELPVDTGPASI
ncbi:hypothetical protein J7J84_06490 [bacterium]|nr:hypothetical protein [bacterium]